MSGGIVLNDDDDDVITTLSSLTASEQGAGSSKGHKHTQLQQQQPVESQAVRNLQYSNFRAQGDGAGTVEALAL